MVPITAKTEYLDAENAALLNDCIGAYTWKREAAELKLLQRPEEVLQPLLNGFNIRMISNRVIRKSNFKSDVSFLLFVTAAMAYMLFSTPKISGDSWNAWSMILPFMLIVVVNPYMSSKYNSDTQTIKYANLIAKFKDIRIVGPLVETLCIKNLGISRRIVNRYAKIEDALIKILPNITSEEDIVLTPNQVTCLIKSLGLNNDDLRIAILYAMPFVGNKAALDAVRRLAKYEKFNTHQAVVEAAQKCIPVLEARVSRLNSVETLLRPSSFETRNDTLLRPTEYTPEIHPEELLRSSKS